MVQSSPHQRAFHKLFSEHEGGNNVSVPEPSSSSVMASTRLILEADAHIKELESEGKRETVMDADHGVQEDHEETGVQEEDRRGREEDPAQTQVLHENDLHIARSFHVKYDFHSFVFLSFASTCQPNEIFPSNIFVPTVRTRICAADDPDLPIRQRTFVTLDNDFHRHLRQPLLLESIRPDNEENQEDHSR